MRRRKLLLVLAALAIVLCAASVFVLWPQPIVAGLTQENFDWVAEGMTRPEVEALLGKPSDFDGGGTRTRPPGGILPEAHPDWGIYMWEFRSQNNYPPSFWNIFTPDKVEIVAAVSFDTTGEVSSKYSERFVVREPASLAHSLRWLRTEWRRWFAE